jgi:hypothetical protein
MSPFFSKNILFFSEIGFPPFELIGACLSSATGRLASRTPDRQTRQIPLSVALRKKNSVQMVNKK